MLEIVILGVIFLAIGYWTVLFKMGRREDVLHGEFVEERAQSEAQAVPATPTLKIRPIFPEQPVGVAVPIPVQPAKAAPIPQPAFRPERLESLLNSIKQDLNQLVQK